MGEPSPKLAATHFQLHGNMPSTPRPPSSNTNRSDHAEGESSSTGLALLSCGLGAGSRPSPFFHRADLNPFDQTFGGQQSKDLWPLEFSLPSERPPSPFLTRLQATAQINDPIVTTSKVDDVLEPVFNNMQGKGQHSLRGGGRQSCSSLSPAVPNTSQVREHCSMNMLNRCV